MAYRTTSNLSTVVVESDLQDGEDIFVTHTSSPNKTYTHIRRTYADENSITSKELSGQVRTQYYSRSPDRRSPVHESKRIQNSQGVSNHSRSEFRQRELPHYERESQIERYVSKSPSRTQVLAGSNIKIDDSKTIIYKPDKDDFFNQRESYLTSEEKRVYEHPLKNFDKTIHTMYADRHNDFEDVKLGQTTLGADPYSRLRKTQELNEKIVTSTVIRNSPQIERYHSPTRLYEKPDRFLSTTAHQPLSVVETFQRSPVREHHYSKTELIRRPQRIEQVKTSPFNPSLTQYVEYSEKPQVVHEHRTTHQSVAERSPKSAPFDTSVQTHDFGNHRKNLHENSSKKLSAVGDNIEFEYRHKFASGSTLVQANPNTKTVIEETKEYDDGQSLIQRTTYENGVEIGSETISPAKPLRIEKSQLRSPPRQDSAYLRSPQRGSNSKTEYHTRTVAEERSSPFRYSPIRREKSDYFNKTGTESVANDDRRFYQTSTKISEVDPEEETSGRIISKHKTTNQREREPEIISHRPYSKPQTRTIVNNHTYGYSPAIIEEEIEIRHEPVEQETFTKKVYSSDVQATDSTIHRYSPSRSRFETYAPKSDQKDHDITIEKTVITIKGGNQQTSTERDRVLLNDKLRKQIEESQALVEDLLESNRRNTHKLKDTINHIEIEYQTPSKKLPLGARDRSTADTFAGRYAN